jgi:hypothetical protein
LPTADGCCEVLGDVQNDQEPLSLGFEEVAEPRKSIDPALTLLMYVSRASIQEFIETFHNEREDTCLT